MKDQPIIAETRQKLQNRVVALEKELKELKTLISIFSDDKEVDDGAEKEKVEQLPEPMGNIEIKPLIELPIKPSKEFLMEKRFLELCEGLELKENRNKFPNFTFLIKNGEVWFEIEKKQNEKTGYFWCSFDHYWLIFEKEFELKYTEIQSFTKGMAERYFKLKDLTPIVPVQILFL